MRCSSKIALRCNTCAIFYSYDLVALKHDNKHIDSNIIHELEKRISFRIILSPLYPRITLTIVV